MKALALASPVTSGLAFLCFAALPATAQNQTWIRQFGTNASDRALAAAPDGSGGTYVTGDTDGSLVGPNAGDYDVWLAHYNGTGNQTWIRQFGTSGSDQALTAAPDGSGGVYLGGTTSGSLGGPSTGSADAWLARYDSVGNFLWILQLGTNGQDLIRAAAPDGSGGVYVGGSTPGSLGGPSSGDFDSWLARYDSAANQIWIRQFGTSSTDEIRFAAPDGSGGVYVGGDTSGTLGGPNAGIVDAWLAHYDGAGNQTWIHQFGTSSQDRAFGSAPDGSGGVYVGGYTSGSLGGPNAGAEDIWLAHYDGTGNQTWIRQLGTGGDDGSSVAAPDGSGGVYVGGYTEGSLGGPFAGFLDSWLARYDGAGNQIWIRQLGTSGIDHAYAAAPDGSGSVYLGGYTDGSLGAPNAGSFDSWLGRYDRVPPPLPTTFCTAKTTLFCGAANISAAGLASATATNGFVIKAEPARGCRAGLLLYSDQPPSPALPFGGPGNGLLCLFFGVRRAGPIESGGTSPQLCDGILSIDMNEFRSNNWADTGCSPAPGQTSPASFLDNMGTTVNAQMWGRDSIATGQVLSDGISWVVGP
jgi:hypothetical protein